ncbi:SDR family NAD(P)-dependent oxidoreductase [Streptomyces sp. GD-15H]|uniref:type I polyketide synthase n=1 Tax=Streptomyces sp. GD-15H TaxID=3129112 RepID=UPI00324DA4C7
MIRHSSRPADVLDDIKGFDAGFFGISPREAELMDPQHRILLECAWAAMEASGHDPARTEGLVGVYAGAGHNTYLLHNVGSQPGAVGNPADKLTIIGNRSDFVSSRISYKLGLEGPSLNIQSACSTSLVAVVEACQALLAYQCDLALAGGVSVDAGRRDGYLYREDGIFSPDGYCRTFDARAQGTAGADGVGMVVLKRLRDALADRDHIHAIIKGSAVNNDGARRAGFTAPNAVTQSAVITAALANADIPAESIDYVELHGTATALGDPIEFSALTSAFVDAPVGGCALGSVKSNIGHLDSAAGIAGLIKTVLAVEHGQLPPSLHFEEPNPRIALDGSPFYVNTELRLWPQAEGRPRRAGVSAFGLGGTNAHVVIEQAPEQAPEQTDLEHLIVLSARSPEALEKATDRLQDHLRSHPGSALTDVARTLQQGRKAFPHRRTLVCEGVDAAIEALEARTDGRLLTASVPESGRRSVAFVFTGFGTQFPGMARGLYRSEPVFAQAVDRCAALLAPLLGEDIRTTLFAEPRPSDPAGGFARMLEQPAPSTHPIDQPRLGYPAVFVLEYALAKLWASWGVTPEAMIGHSLGEYVAACVAGVFSLPDALRLVVARAALIERQPEGAMLAVPLSEAAASAFTTDDVCVAAVNGPRSCVLSGTVEGIERAARTMAGNGVVTRRLTSRYAFHSALMDPVIEPYTELVRSVRLSPPSRPFVSNVTGTWITDAEATDPGYWAGHVRATVRFADGVGTLWSVPGLAVVEIGPAPTLMPDLLQHPAAPADRVVVPTLPGPSGRRTDRAAMLAAAGRLWLSGVPSPFPPVPSGKRIPLPTYPFEHRSYWLEPGGTGAGSTSAQQRNGSLPQWFYAPSWQRLTQARPAGDVRLDDQSWLVFADANGVGRRLAEALRERGATVRTVEAGTDWIRQNEHEYAVDPAEPTHYRKLAEAMRADGAFPDRVVHCWTIGDDADRATAPEQVEALLQRSFHSIVRWAQETEAELMTRPQRWDIVSTEVCSVLGDEPLCPPKAAVQGLGRVIGQEYPSLVCTHIDLLSGSNAADTTDRLLAELTAAPDRRTVALRGRHRWTLVFTSAAPTPSGTSPVRRNGVYLITGGLGKIGLLMARILAEREPVRLVLLGRSGLPERQHWDDHDHPAGVRSAIDAVRELERLGSQVMVVTADVADSTGMAEVRQRILREYGSVNGVLHCAGTTGQAAHRVLPDLGPEESSWHFRPKLIGAQILDDLLVDQELDFAIICSSVAALLGGLGFGAYAAANAALDAFAQHRHVPGRPWTSVNWEGWFFSDHERTASGLGEAVRDLALTPDEGRRVFEAILDASAVPQIAVSTGDLSARQDLWADPIADVPTPARRHERPNLTNPYVAPNGETERRVAEIWQDLLGVEGVGVHDNFFELGGSSLLGLQVVHRLRQELMVAVPLTIVYEGPTVRTLAALVSDLKSAR